MTNPTKNQIGGDHYAKLAIQPMEYALANGLNYAQANAIKYITRYKDKGGLEDLHKAIHCIELLLAFEIKQASKADGHTVGTLDIAVTYEPSERWTEEDEARMDSIGQNGNTGEHYEDQEEWEFSGCERDEVYVIAKPFGCAYVSDGALGRRSAGTLTEAPAGRYLRQDNGKYRLEVQ